MKQVMQECVSNGAAIFFSTHVLDVAEKLCNKVAIIKAGSKLDFTRFWLLSGCVCPCGTPKYESIPNIEYAAYFYSLLSIHCCTWGILNKKYPNYAWENEMLVVKQSFPVIVSNIISIAAVALPVLLHWTLSFPLMPALWGVAAAAITAASIMYQKTCKSKFI